MKITSVKEAKAHVKKVKAGKPSDLNFIDEKGKVFSDNYWVCEDSNVFTDYNAAMSYTKGKLNLYHYGVEVKESK